MIRVLVVDDEKIVRKGLVTFMPWLEFGMTVVGEANNGLKALEFMETNRVDLLLTDLSMPVMSGIELMREVRQRYPHTQIVVLTLHQDFEYIQEALRLGAVDYIAKTELDQERFEDVLSRITSLLEQKDSFKAPADKQDKLGRADVVLAVYALNQCGDEGHADLFVQAGAAEVDAGIWCFMDGQASGIEAPGDGYFLVRFEGLQGLDRRTLLRLLRIYQKNDLFYDYNPSGRVVVTDSERFLNRDKREVNPELGVLKNQWLSLQWIFEDSVYKAMLQELYAMRQPAIRLTRMFFALTDEWNRLHRNILDAPVVVEDFFNTWHEFAVWLSGVRQQLNRANSKPQYSKDIQNSIVKAMNLAQQQMDWSCSASEMAHMVNMSSSYFSQCFKQITGKTYTDYLRDIRMERAKEYLKGTTHTIQWIAENVGYRDEKYFSRLFREHIGMLPSDYRQSQ